MVSLRSSLLGLDCSDVVFIEDFELLNSGGEPGIGSSVEVVSLAILAVSVAIVMERVNAGRVVMRAAGFGRSRFDLSMTSVES